MKEFLEKELDKLKISQGERKILIDEFVDWEWEFFEEEGVDMEGAGEEEILEADKVFDIGDGRYLIVEG